MIGGLAFGLALVGLIEYRDTKLRTDEDIVTSLSLPVMAVIPTMFTPAERARHRRRRMMVAVATSVVVAIGAAGAVAWRLNWLDGLVR